MPSFDLDSVLRKDKEPDDNVLRGGYQFAHKFYTNIEKKDALLTFLPDGTRVWQIGVKSKGAYSINLLLRNFEIPEGGKLFVYNTDYSHIIGSFDYRNNSPEKILPLQPVSGESIILEYSEPPNTTFEGNFTLAEVNHDYRGFLRNEPGTAAYLCMPDALCSDATEETIRSTVLLIINGTSACSGSLINNTEDDGLPYLLTAVHCFNTNLPVSKDLNYYIEKAGTVIAFFNYHSPVCDIQMRGVEEMSMAVAYPRVILEKNDVALLEFQDTPPDYYNAYYAGWNVESTAGSAPYTNLHHPNFSVKKYGKAASVALVTFEPTLFNAASHWRVPAWAIGSTHFGSSGSPLFDKNNLIIGGLSGGYSECNGTNPNNANDFFFALYKGWENITSGNVTSGNQVKNYLDPNNEGVSQHSGYDPHEDNPFFRLKNADYNSGDQLITSELSAPNSGFVFGNSNLPANLHPLEFAEEFTVGEEVEVFGSYFIIPSIPYSYTSGVEVSIYSGSASSPGTKLQSKVFSPKYLNYTTLSGFGEVDKNLSSFATESFVLFDDPVTVNNKFYISYKVNYSTSAGFCVYNTNFSNSSHPNTAWVKTGSGWIQATNHSPYYTGKTALAIQALVRKTNVDTINPPNLDETGIYYDRTSRTLFLREPASETVLVNIYSVTGQLLEKTQFDVGQTSCTLSKKDRGMIGIIKVLHANKLHPIKIIY
jgi:hypothetical protein